MLLRRVEARGHDTVEEVNLLLTGLFILRMSLRSVLTCMGVNVFSSAKHWHI